MQISIFIVIFKLKTVLAIDYTLGVLNPNFTNKRITETAIERVREKSKISCSNLCHRTKRCRSFAFNNATEQCELYNKDFLYENSVSHVSEDSWMYYYVIPIKARIIPKADCTPYPNSNQRPCSSFCMRYVSYGTKTHIANAATKCAEMNGELIKVDRELKQHCAEKLLDIVTDGVVYMQGRKMAGVWRFDDGSEMNFFNWNTAGGQPSSKVSEDCVGIRKDNHYKWHDFFDGDVSSFVCDIY